jgi:rhodanese-related sulfurtransferase
MAPALAEQLGTADTRIVIDVRTEKEWQAGHIEGSVNIPLNRLVQQMDEIPDDGDVVVHCQTGYRSSIATSLLQGRRNVTDLVGGFDAWKASHLPVAAASVSAA